MRIVRQLKWWWFDFQQGCKNIMMFWRVIWRFKPWDYGYQLQLWRASLVPLRDAIQAGSKVEAMRLKKVAKIQHCIDLIDRIQANDYFALAEAELGETVEILDIATEYRIDKFKRVAELAEKTEESDWLELWKTLQGQRYAEFQMMHEKLELDTYDAYETWFDGSGMKNWWD
jgi:hypothetical protein